ncbi:helix-turn-helix domain-containing protein [Dyella telluris]|uniref:CRP-like protein Clp n=1 Tax=Dyella telluris TaxID=2763498 RepID=A0A7G8Q346_9GAMM|nr:helix-turn-helix domain-containing protein [Dyella telluris]QNK01204.1 helix-turn-helix domain-containing protein [Dyella telluris]
MRRPSQHRRPDAAGDAGRSAGEPVTARRQAAHASPSGSRRRASPSRSPHAPVADQLPPCTSCAFAGSCLVTLGQSPTSREYVAGRAWSCEAGDVVVRRGEALREIHVVRKGGVKAFVVASDGREQVLGFHLPGELIGLDAIHLDRHPGDVVALQSSEFCRLSFDEVLQLSSRVPKVQQQLLRLISRELGRASQLAGDLNAEERVASFLLDQKRRSAVVGGKAQVMRLPMSRMDMANYLRLAAETVSRVFGRFRARGWVDVTGRKVRLLDAEALHRVCQDSPRAGASPSAQ